MLLFAQLALLTLIIISEYYDFKKRKSDSYKINPVEKHEKDRRDDDNTCLSEEHEKDRRDDDNTCSSEEHEKVRKDVNNAYSSNKQDETNNLYGKNKINCTWQEANSAGIYFRTNGKRCIITSYRGNAEEVIIPDEIDGKPVKAIGSGAFRGTNVKSVYIPDTVNKIGNEAFAKSNITSVELPENIEYIGDRAFCRCRFLENVTSRKKNMVLVRFGDYVFERTGFIYSGNYVVLNNLLIKYNGWLQNTVVIPDNTERILSYAFKNRMNRELCQIVFPKKNIFIDKNAFYECSCLKKLISDASSCVRRDKPIIRVKCMVRKRRSQTNSCEKGVLIFEPRGIDSPNQTYYNICSHSSASGNLQLEFILDEYLEHGMKYKILKDKICFAYTYIRLSDNRNDIKKFTEYLLENKKTAIRYLLAYDEQEMMKDLIDWHVIDKDNIEYAISRAEQYNCFRCAEYLYSKKGMIRNCT